LGRRRARGSCPRSVAVDPACHTAQRAHGRRRQHAEPLSGARCGPEHADTLSGGWHFAVDAKPDDRGAKPSARIRARRSRRRAHGAYPARDAAVAGPAAFAAISDPWAFGGTLSSIHETIDDWSKALGMSRRAFARLFRQTGLSFVAWRQQACLLCAMPPSGRRRTCDHGCNRSGLRESGRVHAHVQAGLWKSAPHLPWAQKHTSSRVIRNCSHDYRA